MTPRKQSTSPWLSYLLMGGILTFGAGAATLVLSAHSGKEAPAALPKPTPVVAAVRAAVSAPPARPVQPALATESTISALAAEPALSALAAEITRSAPVPVAPAAPVAVPTVSVESAKPSPAPAVTDKVPAVVAAPVPVAPASAPVPVPAKPTEVVVKVAPAAVAQPDKVNAPALPAAIPTPSPKKPVRRAAAPHPAAVVKRLAVQPRKVEAVAAMPLPPAMPVPPVPRMAASAPEHAAPESDSILESRPTPKAAGKAEAKAETRAAASDTEVVNAPKATVKPARAVPLVPHTNKPTVVMATGNKAWVKLDDQRTVIVTKGQDVPGLGTFQGSDKGAAKFDSGTVPVNQ